VNELTLRAYPTNVAALAAKARLVDPDKTSAGKTENEANSVCDELVCEGELAYALRFLGPPFYREAMARYDTLVARYEQLDDDERWALEEKMSSWCFYRAQTDNRIIYPGFFRTFACRGLTVNDVLEKMAESLRFPMQGTDVEFKARALVELVDAHSKCITHGATLRLPEVNPEELLNRALKTSQQDPYVLKKFGKLYMLRAAERKAGDDYDQLMRPAIRVYEQYEQYGGPLMSVIHFHRARAYRSLSRHISLSGRDGSALLEKAKTYFEESIRLDGNSCKTMTELAMTCNYLKQYGDCEEWFTKAGRLLEQTDIVCDKHAPFVYIRWGACKGFRQLKDANIDVNRDVLPLHREAMQCILKWRKREYNKETTLKYFCKRLHEEFRQAEGNTVLHLETVLWKPVLEQFDDHAHPITDILKQNSKSDTIVRRLVNLLVNGEVYFIPAPASAAFLYLTVLFTCDLLKVNVPDDRLFAVDVANKIFRGMLDLRSEDAVNLVARDTYRWLTGPSNIGSKGFPDAASSVEWAADFPENDEIDVCVIKLADLESKSTVDAVDAMLRHHLGLHLVNAEMSTSLDPADIVEMVARSKSLLIVGDGVLSSSSTLSLNEVILDRLPATVVVVRVVVMETTNGDENPAKDVPGAERWPSFVASDHHNSPSGLAFSLLETISAWSFGDHQQLVNIDGE